MPYQRLTDGLYLIRQSKGQKGLHHYGVLDVGNRMQLPNVGRLTPVVFHLAPPSIRTDWLTMTGVWDVIDAIRDEAMAIVRTRTAVANPTYDLFDNNCEHFARYVATGRRESVQLRTVVTVASLLLVVVLVARHRR